MAVFLKTILAICLLAEIISTTPLKQLGKFKREAEKMEATLQRKLSIVENKLIKECENLKKSPCGNAEIRRIRFEPRVEQRCKTYSQKFCQVNEALNSIPQGACNRTVSKMHIPNTLYEQNSNCTLSHTRGMPMKEFCPVLLEYVSSVKDRCVERKQ